MKLTLWILTPVKKKFKKFNLRQSNQGSKVVCHFNFEISRTISFLIWNIWYMWAFYFPILQPRHSVSLKFEANHISSRIDVITSVRLLVSLTCALNKVQNKSSKKNTSIRKIIRTSDERHIFWHFYPGREIL